MPAVSSSSSIRAGSTGLGKKARVLFLDVMACLTVWNVWSAASISGLVSIFTISLGCNVGNVTFNNNKERRAAQPSSPQRLRPQPQPHAGNHHPGARHQQAAQAQQDQDDIAPDRGCQHAWHIPAMQEV